MLAMICHKPAWMNRLVTIVHGLARRLAGCNPRRKISFGTIIVAVNSRKLTAIKAHTGVSLKLR